MRMLLGDDDRVCIGEWWFDASRGYPVASVVDHIRTCSGPPRIPLAEGWAWVRFLRCRQGAVVLRVSQVLDSDQGTVSGTWIPVEVVA